MNKCCTDYKNVAKFVNNIKENYRNCVYITCSVCQHKREECCGDLLVSFDSNGIPTFITASDARYLFRTVIDKSECIAEISNVRFMVLFSNFFARYANLNIAECPMLQLAKREIFPDFREKLGN